MNSECDIEGTITNKQVKTLLIDHFGEEISFTYPRKRSKSQLVFSTKTSVKQTVKKIWASKPLLEVTDQLANELKTMIFNLKINTVMHMVWNVHSHTLIITTTILGHLLQVANVIIINASRKY